MRGIREISDLEHEPHDGLLNSLSPTPLFHMRGELLALESLMILQFVFVICVMTINFLHALR